jgi:hypothetical protein
MKPTKSFIVEIKRKGRRSLMSSQTSLWDVSQLKSATEAVEESTEPFQTDSGSANQNASLPFVQRG